MLAAGVEEVAEMATGVGVGGTLCTAAGAVVAAVAVTVLGSASFWRAHAA